MFERRPDVVAVDAHPGYVSSTLGRAFAERMGAEVVTVQHHHAHLAACMAENGVESGEVLGIVMDGTGFGDDGTSWGGEFLVGSYEGYPRVAHFLPVPLIGGDRAATEPWRNAYAHLAVAMGAGFTEGAWRDLPVMRNLAARPQAALRSIMASRSLSPLSSSAGRLFDAAGLRDRDGAGDDWLRRPGGDGVGGAGGAFHGGRRVLQGSYRVAPSVAWKVSGKGC